MMREGLGWLGVQCENEWVGLGWSEKLWLGLCEELVSIPIWWSGVVQAILLVESYRFMVI